MRWSQMGHLTWSQMGPQYIVRISWKKLFSCFFSTIFNEKQKKWAQHRWRMQLEPSETVPKSKAKLKTGKTLKTKNLNKAGPSGVKKASASKKNRLLLHLLRNRKGNRKIAACATKQSEKKNTKCARNARISHTKHVGYKAGRSSARIATQTWTLTPTTAVLMKKWNTFSSNFYNFIFPQFFNTFFSLVNFRHFVITSFLKIKPFRSWKNMFSHCLGLK